MPFRLRKTPLVGIVLMFVIMGALALRIDWARVETLAATLDVNFIGASIVMFICQLVFLACRWHILINVNRSYMHRTRSSRIFYLSNVTNFVFLTSLSGMIVRLLLSVRAGSPWLNALCASVADRLFSFGVLLASALLTLPSTIARLGHVEISRSFTHLLILLTIVALGFGIYLLKNPSVLQNLMGLRRFRVARAYFLRLIRSSNMALALLYSFAAQSSFFLGVYFILCASHISISFFDMMTILPAIAVLAALPLTIGGWGLREGVYVIGLGLLGVSIENAFLASIQVGLFTMLASTLIALPVLFNRRLYADLRPGHQISEKIYAFLNKK